MFEMFELRQLCLRPCGWKRRDRATIRIAHRTRRILIVWLLAASFAQAQIGDGRAVPGQMYFLPFRGFYQGEYRDSLQGFRSAANSGINTGAGRWVDSICYFTMMGECFYHMGDLSSALQQYDAAIQLIIARQGWLKRIQLQPPAIGPWARAKPVPWGPTARNTVAGEFPEMMLSLQGTDLNTVLQRGGTVVAPELYPLRVVEIMRCSALALRRRREILGPVAPQLPLTSQVIKALSRQEVPANHWLQTLIDVQLAIAKSAAGDEDEALATLQRSLVVSGRLDHPLTALALLEIGDLALKRDDLELAQKSYFEASFPAAVFGQADVLEEALVGAARIHTWKGQPGLFAPLTTAAEWCRIEDYDRAAAAILLAATEQTMLSGDARQASKLLTQTRAAMGRSDLRGADLGVDLLYRNAQLAFESDNATAGMKALGEAFRLHKTRSKQLFQLELTNQLYTSKELSPRVAGLLLNYLLREPTPQDWQQRREETLLFETTPHLPVLERWLEVTLDRSTGGNFDTLVTISEAIRRHKFYSQLPLAGRLLALRWVLEGPDVLLDEETQNQRQNIVNKYPEVAVRSRQISELKVQLSQLPTVPEGDSGKAYERVAKELSRVADEQETMLWRLALRPDPARRMFPPLLTLDQIQSRMTDGQAILSFVALGNEIHALLLTPDNRYKEWPLNAPNKMQSDLSSLLREIGNVDQKQVLLAERLSNSKWRDLAAALFEPLAAELSAETLTSLNELVIVPDGFLWYLPFEMLQVTTGSERKSLIDLVPVRYAPTIGLAVQDARPKTTSGPRVIVHGRLFSRETDPILAAAADQLKEQQPQSTILRRRLPHATRYVSSVWQELVVLDDIEGLDKDALAWSPAQIDQGKPGGALTDWMTLPWGAPDVIVLPGYHTAAEDGLRRRSSGDEMLIASCGLMAAGTRTILVSRWQTAGRSSMDLVREFLQELPVQSAAAAWQRSVLLARSGELDPTGEPRLKGVEPGELPPGDHPFFWAGYLLMGAW